MTTSRFKAPEARAASAGEPAEVVYLLMMDTVARLRKAGVPSESLTELRKSANSLTEMFGTWQDTRPREGIFRRKPKPLTQEQFEQRADKYRSGEDLLHA